MNHDERRDCVHVRSKTYLLIVCLNHHCWRSDIIQVYLNLIWKISMSSFPTDCRFLQNTFVYYVHSKQPGPQSTDIFGGGKMM